MHPPEQTTYPSGGKRLIVYRLGSIVDDHVLVAVSALRIHASRIVVEFVREPESSDRERLAAVADEVRVAERPEARTIGSVADDLERHGAAFDEVLITDDSWFGPVSPLRPIFERMDATAAHAWTMTPAGKPGAETWVAVRRPRDGRTTWAEMVPHVFDALTADRDVEDGAGTSDGAKALVVATAFPSRRYPGPDPVVFDCRRLLAEGCPVLSRRVFTSPPALLERHSVIGRDVLRAASASGYSRAVILQNLARTVAPRRLNANLGLLAITRRGEAARAVAPRVVVLAHFGEGDDPSGFAQRIAAVRGAHDIVATTAVGRNVPMIRSLLADAPGVLDVRCVPSGADDVGAAFVGCRDVLRDGGHDVVVKVHAGRRLHESANARRYLARHTWDNLLGSGDQLGRVLAMFEDPGLGIVFPPTPHIGLDTLGSGWRGRDEEAARFARRVGIGVPLGDPPLEPVGGMWIARRSALRLLVEQDWSWEDYLPGKRWDDLARMQESMLAHAAGQLGFHVHTVLTPEHAAISHAPLEYKMDQLASTTPGFPVDQIGLLLRMGWVGSGGLRDFARMYLRANHDSSTAKFPRITRLAERALRVSRPDAREVSDGAR